MEAVLTQAINRLEAVLAGESNALRAGLHLDLGEMANRKNQSLMELSRIARGIEPRTVSPNLKVRIDTLRERLEDNRRLLAVHMEATVEISGLIARSMAEAESDGTYEAPTGGIKRDR